MKTWQWLTLIVVALVALLAGAMLGPFLFGQGVFGGYRGIMGPGMMQGWAFAPFGWMAMLFMMLFPLGLLVLVVLGIIWLVTALSRTTHHVPAGPVAPAAPSMTCPSCGRPIQADWHNCPYCGAPLAG